MTELHLLNVPFESNYKDTVWFASPSEQTSYMEEHRTGKSFTDFSYQRKDNIIRVPAHIDTLYNCNYVQYKNKNVSNRWFYAFIVDMKYINDERTDITIQTDVIQTWFFDYAVRESFIEREHVNDDTPGANTVPEQVEHGEYKCSGISNSQFNNAGYGVIIASSVNIAEKIGLDWFDKFDNAKGGVYNGVFSGLAYYYVPVGGNAENVVKALKEADTEGQGDAIHSIFMCPKSLVDLESDSDGNTIKETNGYKIGVVKNGYLQKTTEWNSVASRPTAIEGYTPDNKKLLTYPYCYLLASNNAGMSNTYEYELFESGVASFNIISAVTPGMSVRLIPLNYAGQSENHIEGLTLGKFPICAWTSDVFTNWLTQQGVNIAVDVASATTQIGLGVATIVATGGAGAMAGAGMIASGINGVRGTVGEIYAHSTIPPVAKGNINSGDVSFASNKTCFSLCKMNIKKEYAQIIDEYFNMFGYKVCRVKKPLKDHRRVYWYTKTIDVNIDGAIPNKDLDAIKQCYNNGITFWRSTATMGEYKVTNTIVSPGTIT